MKIFIWECVSKASYNYHEGGGVVVVASCLERAVEIANDPNNKWKTQIKADELPDAVYAIADDNAAEALFVMPDAGCC